MLLFGLTPFGSLFRKKQVRSTIPVNEIFQKHMRAAYDAAKTTVQNENHWANADLMGPNASASYEVRRMIWSRARYEANQANSFAKGMVLTKTNDIVGTGPRIQIETGNGKANRLLEKRITEWMEAIRLAKKIWTGRNAITIDGACVYRAYLNPRLKTPVKLDVSPMECDRLVGRPEKMQQENYVEGIQFDEYDNALTYDFLRYHPGENGMFTMGAEYLPPVKSKYVMHMFRPDRPGQKHGVSEIATSLPLFAQLRRYTLATIAAAESAAEIAAVMQSTSGAFTADDVEDVEALEAIDFAFRQMLTLPKGWSISQVKAEHPTTTYVEFRNAILNEASRCMNMPFNIAAGNSSSYNYASGRLDHQGYFKSILLDQTETERELLKPLVDMWLEYAMFAGQIPDGLPPWGDWIITWHWDGTEHVDPKKEADAENIKLKNMSTTYASVYARKGKDWETEIRQIAKEQKLIRDLELNMGAIHGESTEETGEAESEEREEEYAEAV